MHSLKAKFNQELLGLRSHKVCFIERMKDHRKQLIAAQAVIPVNESLPVPHIPVMISAENPHAMTSWTHEEVLAFKTRKEDASHRLSMDTSKATKPKKEPTKMAKRRIKGVMPMIAARSSMEKANKKTSVDADVGSFVQVVKALPTPLEKHIAKINLIKARFHEKNCIELIEKEKFKFDANLKILRHRKVSWPLL